MSLTNLTGTKWLFTSEGMAANAPQGSYYCNTVYVTSGKWPYSVYSGRCFKVNFTKYAKSSPQYVTSYAGIGFRYYETDQLSSIPAFPFTSGTYTMNDVFYAFNSSIFDEAHKTSYGYSGLQTSGKTTEVIVEFTGGEDITNPSLISWFENNATRIVTKTLKVNNSIVHKINNAFVSSINGTNVQCWNTPSLISFSIADVSYQAQANMTWTGWCDSIYNTAGFYEFSAGTIADSTGGHAVAYQNGDSVSPNDTITADYAYRSVRNSG